MPTTPNISSKDKEQIEKLRKAVKDQITPYYDTDFNLLRWLKGHNYNFEEIVPKIKNHLILRNSHLQLDSAADKPRDHPIHHYWRSGLTKRAGKTPNVLVNIEQTGSNDYWGILHAFPLNEIMKARIYDLETMLRAVMRNEEETGEQTSIMYIMDLTGLKYDKNLMSLLTGALASISAFMSEHYVELIHNFVLVGAPSFITAIWAIAKPILPERTKNKVKIFGSNWKSEILTVADPDALPSYWNEPGKDVYLAQLDQSVSVDPNSYYKLSPIKDALLLNVPAGKTGFTEIAAEKGQKLSWIFEADGHFAYGIFYSKDPKEADISKMKPIYPRFNKVPGPTFVPLNDYVICEQSGVYKFWFSNEHAWFHSLTIRHKITVGEDKEN